MRVLKMLWLASFLIFVLVHVLAYAQYEGEFVYLGFDAKGTPSPVIKKDAYFNIMLGAMVVLNLAALVLGGLPPHLPKRLIWVPQKSLWLSSPVLASKFFYNFAQWAKGLGLISNLFLAWAALMIYTINVKMFLDISGAIYIFLLAILAWMGAYVYIFAQNPDKLESKNIN